MQILISTWRNSGYKSSVLIIASVRLSAYSQQHNLFWRTLTKSPSSLKWSEVKWKSLSHVWLFATPWTVWNSPGQNTWLGSLSLLQGIFPTQGLNPHLPHCRQNLYQLSHKGSPRILPAIWRVKEELSVNWWLILVNKSVYGVKISFEMLKYFTCLIPS